MSLMKDKIIPLLCIFILFGCQKNDIEVYNGKDTSFEKLKGQWIIVNYWADWCAPCIKELPELFEFAEENNMSFIHSLLDDASIINLPTYNI